MKNIAIFILILCSISCSTDDTSVIPVNLDGWTFESEIGNHSSIIPNGVEEIGLTIESSTLCDAYAIEIQLELNGNVIIADTISEFPYTLASNIPNNFQAKLNSRPIIIDPNIDCILFGVVSFTLESL
jgi:hypothetical protein